MGKNRSLWRLSLVPDANTESIVNMLDVRHNTHRIYNAVYTVNTNDELITVG